MVVKCYVFETRGGAVVTELEPSEASWEVQSNTAETISPTFQLSRTSGLRNLLTPWKHSIAVDIRGRLFGGPIMPHDFDEDAARLKVTARGLRVLFGRRSILPVEALTQSLTLPDGTPDTSLDTVLTDLDLGSIGRAIGVQACEWPGFDDIPIVWGSARAGTRTETYPAVDRKKVDDAWSDLSARQNGPDIRLQLRWADADSFESIYESGTEAQPRLQGEAVHAWEPAQGSGLKVTVDPSRMGSLVWSEGGRSSDQVLIRSLYDSTLIDKGFPLLELESDASVTTSDPATLDSWNAEALRTAGVPWEFWSFRVRADQSPFPYEYNCGDLITVTVTEETPVSGGYIPPGVHSRRIVGISGDLSEEWVTITCGVVYG